MNLSNSLAPSLDQLVQQIEAQSSHIKGPREPTPSKAKEYSHLLQSIARLRGRPLFYPYVSSGLGRGPLVQLKDGSVKLDFICGIGPHILGHSHPELIKASLRGALEDVAMQGHLQMNEIYEKLLQKLIELASKRSHLSQAWICPSGSMANENAIKVLLQKKPGSRKILAFERAFAGRTLIMCDITDNPKVKQGLPSFMEVLRVPFCPSDPKRALSALKQHWEREKGEITGFMLELMQGDGGYFLAERDFFVPLLDFCRSKGIAIWLDEIQTFARSGEFFAFESLNLGEYVDVCTIGKAFQMSAVLWTKEYNPRPGLVAGTFASSSVSFHTALEVLNLLEPLMGKGGRIQDIQKGWRARLKVLEEEGLLSETEGWGLMTGTTALEGLPQQVARLLQDLFKRGLICFSCGSVDKKRLRFMLPAVTEDKHLDQAFQILRQSLLYVRNSKKA